LCDPALPGKSVIKWQAEGKNTGNMQLGLLAETNASLAEWGL
jgi:hypothetical protein